VAGSRFLLLGGAFALLISTSGWAGHAAEAAGGGSGHSEIGTASWYGARHQGRRTASGAPFDMRKATAAHRRLPLDTRVRVTNLRNGRTVEVTVTDRVPSRGNRVIDLSASAAAALGLQRSGIGRVKVEVIGDAAG
jgi:rare lipoprotein A